MTHSGIFRLKFFRRLSIAFVLLVSVIAVSVSALLFAAFASTAQDEIARSSRDELRQTAFLISTLVTQVLNAGDSLVNNPAVRRYVASPTGATEDQLRSLLSAYLGVHPFIDSITVYSASRGEALHTKALSKRSSLEMFARANSPDRVTNPGQFALQVSHDDGSGDNLISFVWKTHAPEGDGAATGSVLIHVSENAVDALMKGSNAAGQQELIMLDPGYHVLASTQSGSFLRALGGESFVTQIVFSSGDSGSVESTYADTKSLVSFATVSAANWKLVGIRPMSSLVPNLAELGIWVLIIVVVILAAGSAVAIFAAQSLYTGSSSFFDRDLRLFARNDPGIDEMNMFAAAMDQVRAQCLRHLLLETAPEEPMSAAMFESFKASRPVGPSCVAVIHLDELSAGDSFGETLMRLRTVLEETVRSSFPFSMQVEVYHADDRETVLWAALENTAQADEVAYILRWLQASFRAQSGHGISAGVGFPVEDLTGVPASFRSARRAVDLRFKKGSDSISTFQELDAIPDYRAYPAALEARIIEALSLNKVSELEKAAQDFLEHLSALSTDWLLTQTQELIISLRRHFKPLIGKNPDWQVPEVWHLSSLSDLGAVLDRFYHDTLDALIEKNESRGDEVVEKMKLFVQRNYRDPALNLGMAASAVHLSREYAGRLFRITTGESFAQFLNTFRMEKAKELLETTNQPVALIAEKIGLSNATYLFTLFKKTYSITPAQFRGDL